MGKILLFEILFHKQVPLYFSGELLTGVVNIKLSEKLKINSVNLRIEGAARVHWTEQHGSGKNSRTVHYSSHEQYMNHQIMFLTKRLNEDLYLEAGDHSYPFQIQLPPNLPTSFEHMFGRVRYSVHSTIDIPWAFDKHATRSFTVLSHYDLNSNPMSRQPFGVSDSKILCCGPCASDPITANFSIMKSGYVPGEPLFFNVQLDNKSSREIKEMTVSLVQNIAFHATRKTKNTFRVVCEIRYPKRIPEKTVENWNMGIQIPPVISSSNGTCRIIDVNYSILLNFDASGVAVSKDLPIPIVIGTIPLFDLNLPNQAQPNMPPPSYQASIFEPGQSGIPNDFETKGEVIQSDANTFRPLYPVYKDFSNNNPNNLNTNPN